MLPRRPSRRATLTVAPVALALLAMSIGLPTLPAAADQTPAALPFSQDWSDPGLITTNDVWSGVPSITGYLGGGLVGSPGVNPQTVLADGSATVDVVAQSTATSTAGGVHEVTAAGTVAMQGSGGASAPNLVIRLDTTSRSAITVSYVLRDLDVDNGGAQQFALQYRVGGTGDYTDVTGGYVADASATLGDTFPVSATLPAAADGQAVVDVRIITTDTAGSDSMTGVDDISITAGGTGPVDAAPAPTCPGTLATDLGAAASAPVSAVDADSGIASLAISSAPVAGITLTGSTAPSGIGEEAGATLEVAADVPAGAYAVTITAATTTGQSLDCTVQVLVEAPAEDLRISDVQGSGAMSPRDGDDVAVQGVVTSLFERSDVLDAFFLQEEDADADGDPTTSEGVFVFCRGECPEVAVGDLVRAEGEVDEYFGMTQLAVQGGSTEVLGSGVGLPTPGPVALPADGSTTDAATFEAVEGMLVEFPTTLSVAEYFELARFGQLELTAGGRPYQFTHVSTPDAAANAAYLAEQATRRIILDDDNNDNNDAVEGPDADEPFAYPSGGLSTTNRFRGGDTITGLTGVLHWSFAGASGTDAWRVRPVDGVDYSFTPANPRSAAPAPVGGRLKVASFNVLNYFATVDTTSSSNSGPCGPTGGQDCRGADSDSELERQLAKTVAVITGIDPDVAGLIEIQNDSGASAEQIVAGLNAATAPGTYAVLPTPSIGGDAIKVAFVYQPGSVRPVGDYAVLDSSVDPRFIDRRNRPALVQTFEELATGEIFTVAVNHFKSKGSACTTSDGNFADPDQGDGQGNCPETRRLAAEALADFLSSDPTGSGDPDFLVVGDLNAYKQEDPITTLEAAGYTDLVERFGGDDAYSYVFDGALGYLDHALANGPLAAQVTGTTEWHINADEPVLFDYNDELRDTGEATFERESGALPLFAADPYRASDHDPVVIGLALDSNVLTCQGLVATVLGTPGDDRLRGTNGRDVIVGLGGNDTIDGKGGDDLICGGSGHDSIMGGVGEDEIHGGLGRDALDGQNDDDVLYGGRGDDSLKGGAGQDSLFGDEDADVLAGENGDDQLDGGAGDDSLAGGNGDDVLVGGAGNDTTDGGSGTDTETP